MNEEKVEIKEVEFFKVKIGKFYVASVDLDEEEVFTNFISEITLSPSKENASFLVNKDEREIIRELLGKMLELTNPFSDVYFEEFIEEC